MGTQQTPDDTTGPNGATDCEAADGVSDNSITDTLAEAIRRVAEMAETDGHEPAPHAHSVEATYASLNRTLTQDTDD